jgi:hypothetical protein
VSDTKHKQKTEWELDSMINEVHVKITQPYIGIYHRITKRKALLHAIEAILKELYIMEGSP